MKYSKSRISCAVITACSGISMQAHAVLPDNAILKFDDGIFECAANCGTPYEVIVVKQGSYFGMDTNGSGDILPSERIAIEYNAGVAVNKSQSASGSHSGEPDGSESPGIDKAWAFFGNTGLHYTSSPAALLNASGNTATIDMSGWTVTWNGIDAIPMGSGAWEGNPEGVAVITCGNDCSDGDSFTMNYSATVPAGDPSGFGNVAYNLYMTGTIVVPGEPGAAPPGNYGPGDIALAANSTDGRISMDDLLNNGGLEDTEFTYGGGLFDFTVTGAGANAIVVLPLTAAIPADAVYRKFINGAWTTFTADANNKVQSAASASGVCPAPADPAYVDGLKEGDDCVQLIIEDGGPYDSNGAPNDVSDPGGVATPVTQQVDTRTSGTSGCSMTGRNASASEHADWWLVAGFIGLLGWFSARRKAEDQQA